MGKEKINPIKVAKFWRIKKSGLFDVNLLLQTITSYLSKYQYDFFEKKHDEKSKPEGKEIISEWFAKREVSDYARFIIKIEIFVRNCFDVVVEEESGEKVEKNKGRIEIVFNSEMEKNYEQEKRRKFMQGEVKGTFSNFVKIVYEKYIIKRQLEDYEKKLKVETKDMFDTIKGVVT